MAKLDLLQVANPCQASWEAMRGDDRVRHCLQCHLDVYDLSSMARDDAERFVEENEGHACMRFLQRADGTVITQNCEPLRAEPRPCVPRPPASPGAPSPSAGGISMAAKPASPPAPPRPLPRMGIVAMPPPPRATREPVDPRLTRGTLLAELSRAVRSALGPDDGERCVTSIEQALAVPESWRTASCPHKPKCPLWIPAPSPDETPAAADALGARVVLLGVVAPIVEAAFDAPRAGALLRELKRFPFAGSRGLCPHCRAQITTMSEPVPPPVGVEE